MTTPLRSLPGIDRLLNDPGLHDALNAYGEPRVKACLRDLQNGWRQAGSVKGRWS